FLFFFFQAEDGIRDGHVTGVQTCALPICRTLKLRRRTRPAQRLRRGPGQVEENPIRGRVSLLAGPARRRLADASRHPPLAGRERDRKSVVEGKGVEVGGRRRSERQRG